MSSATRPSSMQQQRQPWEKLMPARTKGS
jgi:hypothetical protein